MHIYKSNSILNFVFIYKGRFIFIPYSCGRGMVSWFCSESQENVKTHLPNLSVHLLSAPHIHHIWKYNYNKSIIHKSTKLYTNQGYYLIIETKYIFEWMNHFHALCVLCNIWQTTTHLKTDDFLCVKYIL